MRVFVVSVAMLGLAGAAAAESNGFEETTVSPEDDTAEIVGGTLTTAGKWPDSVAVLGPQGACTGTLIAPDVVLTAGHCVGGMTQVKANTLDYNSTGGVTATIKSHTAYPNWQQTLDISVIVLNTPITGVTPRPLGMDCTFTSGNFNTMKPNVQLVGFGATDPAGQAANTRQYEVTVPVTDPTCTTTTGAGCQTAVAPSGEFIAGGNNKDSCYGDSGGPVYLSTPRGTMVIGAVSRGFENATTPCGGGGIYVRTGNAVATWIETTTGKTIAKDSCAGGTQPPPSNPMNPDPNNPNPTNPDGTGDPNDEPSNDVTGGCSSSHGTGLGMLFLLGLALGRRRRA